MKKAEKKTTNKKKKKKEKKKNKMKKVEQAEPEARPRWQDGLEVTVMI